MIKEEYLNFMEEKNSILKNQYNHHIRKNDWVFKELLIKIVVKVRNQKAQTVQ